MEQEWLTPQSRGQRCQRRRARVITKDGSEIRTRFSHKLALSSELFKIKAWESYDFFANCSFRHYLVLHRPKEGKGQGTAGGATRQDFRQNTSFASKEYPDM